MKEEKKSVRTAPVDAEGLPIYPFSDAALNPQQPTAPAQEPQPTAEPASPVEQPQPTEPIQPVEPVEQPPLTEQVEQPLPTEPTQPTQPTPEAQPVEQPTDQPAPQPLVDADGWPIDPAEPAQQAEQPTTQPAAPKKKPNLILIIILAAILIVAGIVFAVIMITGSNSSPAPTPAPAPSQDWEDEEDSEDEESEADATENPSEPGESQEDNENTEVPMSENDQRRVEDLNRLATALYNYKNNNNNQLPSQGTVVKGATLSENVQMNGLKFEEFGALTPTWGHFYTSYLLMGSMDTENSFKDPDGGVYSLIISSCSDLEPGTTCPNPLADSFETQTSGVETEFGTIDHAIHIITSARCEGSMAKSVELERNAAIFYLSENSIPLCSNV